MQGLSGYYLLPDTGGKVIESCFNPMFWLQEHLQYGHRGLIEFCQVRGRATYCRE